MDPRGAKMNAEFRTANEGSEHPRDSEVRYRILFERSPLPMWVYDPNTLRFLTVNDAAIRHYGYSREEFLGMTIKDIRPAEDVPALLANVTAHRSSPTNTSIWRHRKKDGTLINVENHLARILFWRTKSQTHSRQRHHRSVKG
jgi:PAS domain S-box-containing protein